MGGQKQSILGNEYWTNMGEAGMKLVLHGFSWEHFLRKITCPEILDSGLLLEEST